MSQAMISNQCGKTPFDFVTFIVSSGEFWSCNSILSPQLLNSNVIFLESSFHLFVSCCIFPKTEKEKPCCGAVVSICKVFFFSVFNFLGVFARHFLRKYLIRSISPRLRQTKRPLIITHFLFATANCWRAAAKLTSRFSWRLLQPSKASGVHFSRIRS